MHKEAPNQPKLHDMLSYLTMPLEFQLLCCNEYDVGRYKGRKCVVVLTGRQANGARAMVICEGFKPSMRTRIDDVDAVDKALGEMAPEFVQEDAYDFKGYHANREPFARWTFGSNMAFMIARKKLRDAGITTYDAALPAAMQMLARSNISPCGWVSVRGHVTTERLRTGGSGSAVDDPRIVRADWTAVVPMDAATTKSMTAPFTIIGSFQCKTSNLLLAQRLPSTQPAPTSSTQRSGLELAFAVNLCKKPARCGPLLPELRARGVMATLKNNKFAASCALSRVSFTRRIVPTAGTRVFVACRGMPCLKYCAAGLAHSNGKHQICY